VTGLRGSLCLRGAVVGGWLVPCSVVSVQVALEVLLVIFVVKVGRAAGCRIRSYTLRLRRGARVPPRSCSPRHCKGQVCFVTAVGILSESWTYIERIFDGVCQGNPTSKSSKSLPVASKHLTASGGEMPISLLSDALDPEQQVLPLEHKRRKPFLCRDSWLLSIIISTTNSCQSHGPLPR
jgi:hypothetical protein